MGTNRLGLPQESETEPPKEQIDLEMLAHSIQPPQQQQANPIEIRTPDSESDAGPQAPEPKEVVQQTLIAWTATSGQQPTQCLACAAELQTEDIRSPAYQQKKVQNFSSLHESSFLGKRVQEEAWEFMLPSAAKFSCRGCLVKDQQPSKPNSLKSHLAAGFSDDFCQPGEEFRSLTLTSTLMPLESILEIHQVGQHAHLQNEVIGGANRVIIEDR